MLIKSNEARPCRRCRGAMGRPMNLPIRVAHVLGALDFGGVETDALILLRHLPRDQIRSSVVYVGERASVREAEFAVVCDEFVRCPLWRRKRFSFVARLLRELRRRRFDAVLSYN